MAINIFFSRLKNAILTFFGLNNMQELLYGTKPISEECPYKMVIHDAVEGNMTFTFKMTRDEFNSSYTNVVALDEHTAEVVISNPNGYGVRSDGQMKVGTYCGQYDLLLSFVLFQDEDNNWNIEYTFYVNRKRNGGHK